MILKNLKYFIVDVDGTLTNGNLFYDNNGMETKIFCVKDGPAFLALRHVGIDIVILSGKASLACEKRFDSLGVKYIFQNVANKFDFLSNFIVKRNIQKEELGYIGDDLNDIAAMSLANFVACPSDSCEEVLNIADYVSKNKGGEGAFRDIVEHVLKQRNQWEKTIEAIFAYNKK